MNIGKMNRKPEKNIKREQGINRYHNMSGQNKRLDEYQKNYKTKKLTDNFFTFLSLHDVKMDKNILILGDQYVNKNAFHKYIYKKNGIDKVEIKKQFYIRKDSNGNKGAFNDDGIAPLCIKLPQINGYAKYFDSNSKYMNLLVRDEDLLKKYHKIWDEVKNLFK